MRMYLTIGVILLMLAISAAVLYKDKKQAQKTYPATAVVTEVKDSTSGTCKCYLIQINNSFIVQSRDEVKLGDTLELLRPNRL